MSTRPFHRLTLPVVAAAIVCGGLAYAAPASAASVPAADAVFLAHGISPAVVVHQSSLRNYAGPNCPGVGWSCTTSRAVVQSSSSTNVFVCSASSGTATSDSSTNSCVVSQTAQSNNGTNSATCDIERTNPAYTTSTCSITQDNTGGQNKATIKQVFTESSGDNQDDAQSAYISQTNTSGKNTANIKQQLVQKISDSAAGQTQQGLQSACIEQDASTGANSGTITQSQNQSEKNSNSSAVNQQQNATTPSTGGCGSVSFDAANLVAAIEQGQRSSGSGQFSATLSQTLKQKQVSSPSTAAATQQQGPDSFEGGLDGHIDQNSTGVATANASQLENQYQDAEGPNPNQSQFGPARCCSLQQSNPSDTFNITQTSTQDSDTQTNQTNEVDSNCQSSGECHVQQNVTVDGTTTSTSCNQPFCNEEVFCEGSFCSTVGGGTSGGSLEFAGLGRRA
jgi:hypothetical protein